MQKQHTTTHQKNPKNTQNIFPHQMTSFDRFPDTLTNHSLLFASTVVVNGITFRLYGLDKDIGMHFAGIYCQETSIWICSMDSMMINAFGTKMRATLSQFVLKSDSTLEALFFVHKLESPQDGNNSK